MAFSFTSNNQMLELENRDADLQNISRLRSVILNQISTPFFFFENRLIVKDGATLE